MGQKTSKTKSKTTPKESSSHKNNFAMYLLPNNEAATLVQIRGEVAAFGSNAILLSRDRNDSSSSSSDTQKYNTYYIVGGHWVPELDEGGKIIHEQKIKSINFNLRDAKLSRLQVYKDIQLISPKTPKYQIILDTALGLGGIQSQFSEFEKLADVVHNIMAPQHDSNILTAAATKATYLPKILDELAEPGQFYTAEQIQQLKKLSEATVTASTLGAFNDAWGELGKYLQSIVGEAVNLTVLNALYQFRNHLEPKGVYTTGHHANLELPREAYQSYDNNFSQFGNNWSSPKNVLCAQKIVGLSQVRGLTAGELQLHAQGLYSVLVDGARSKRSFSFTYGGGSSRPDVSDPLFRLGYNCFVGGLGAQMRGWAAALVAAGGALEFLCQAKTSAQQKLCRDLAINRLGATR